MELKDQISNLPEKPGVYQFFSKTDKLIYVGKAKNLKKRVSSYFTKTHDSAKTNVLVRQIVDIRHIVVSSENDALLLENNLIKKHQPRYNVMLKDDKTFPWICIKNERFPRVFSTRIVVKDGSIYYGPYTSARLVKIILELFKQLYKVRNCNYSLSEKNINDQKFKVCLEYHLGNCFAPCIGNIEEEEYNSQISEIHKILKNNINSLKRILEHRMLVFAKDFKFEEAHKVKEKIEILNRFQAKSTIVNSSITNVDVFSITSADEYSYVNYLKIDKGAIVQSHSIELKKKLDENEEELLSLAIVDIRDKLFSTSNEVILPFKVSFLDSDLKQTVPKRSSKKQLLDLSLRNAYYFRKERERDRDITQNKTAQSRILETIKNDFRLSELPVQIECFDNSNIQGHFPVAACVVFKNAKPSKKEYRHYNIKSVVGPDDFASMEEVVYRRYKRLLEEKSSLPQLIVIDGGKGQLSSAYRSIKKLKLNKRLAIIGIAKRLEEIYFPGDKIPIYLDKNSESLKVIQHIRNEAHRFGIAFHKQKRNISMKSSSLENIPGIGEKTSVKLFKHFKSVENIKNCDVNNLVSLVGKSKARIIKDFFNSK